MRLPGPLVYFLLSSARPPISYCIHVVSSYIDFQFPSFVMKWIISRFCLSRCLKSNDTRTIHKLRVRCVSWTHLVILVLLPARVVHSDCLSLRLNVLAILLFAFVNIFCSDLIVIFFSESYALTKCLKVRQ